jgi:hypothetical protein
LTHADRLTDAGDITAGPRQTRRHPCADRIEPGEDDGHIVGRVRERLRQGRRRTDNHVEAAANEVFGHPVGVLGVVLDEAVLKHEVLAFDPARIA